MVLAAGLGQRMRPLTQDRPKPLIEVAGKPLIDHTLDALVANGVERAVVNVHYRAEQLVAHLAKRTDLDLQISDEREALLETGGGLVKARPLLGGGPILVCNTDQVFLPSGADAIATLLAAWGGSAMDALLLLADREAASGFSGAGDFFRAPDGRIARRAAASSAPFVYTGYHVLDPRVLSGWPLEPFSLNRIWDASFGRARLFGALFQGRFLHVGDPDGLAAAEALLSRRAP
jgi:MurNAc alpha-1-phosphate uridylyltransferase